MALYSFFGQGGTRGVTASEVALRWITQQGVMVVTSSFSVEHIRSGLRSLTFNLTAAEMAQLGRLK